ncbi:MAG: zinc-ribbon domain-containing protein [Actinomycetes bacterium]
MTRHRRRMSWGVGLTAAAVLLSGTSPASAHQHPTPLERAAPGVVFVQAQAQVDVALVQHRQARDPSGIHIVITQSTSHPVMASASGFVVERTGAVVTTGSITAMDSDRAQVFAVNEAFHQAYGTPMPADPFARQQVAPPTDPLQQRLQACYPPQVVNDAGGCVVRVTPTYVVFPYVTDQAKYGDLQAELLPSSTPDIALLQVRGATSLPTVALAQSTNGAQALSDLGFTGPPDADHPLQSVDTHLQQVGGTALKTEGLSKDELADQNKLIPAVPAGLLGGPLVAEEGQVIGFLVPPQGQESVANPPRLVDAAAIRKVLSAEGITPQRGPVDTTFEAAMHPFKNGAYAAAIPALKQTLALFPGHAVANQSLAKAQQEVGPGQTQAAPDASATGQDVAPAATSTSRLPLVLAVVVLVLLAGVGALLFVRRRRAREETPAADEVAAGEVAVGARSPVPVQAASGQRQDVRPPPSATASPPRGTPVVGVAGARAGERTPGESAGRPSRAGQGSQPGTPVPKQVPPKQASAKQASPPRHASGAVAAPASRPRTNGGPAGVGPAGVGPAGVPDRERGVSTPPAGASGSRPSRVGSPVQPSRRGGAPDQPLPAKAQFCTSCGRRLAPGDRFCPQCGHAAG